MQTVREIVQVYYLEPEISRLVTHYLREFPLAGAAQRAEEEPSQ